MKNIAVVGFGFMGLTHTLNILKNDNLNLAAIVEKNPDLIEKTIGTKGGNISTGSIDSDKLLGINKYSNLDDCLKSEDLDAINICVPTILHYEMTKKALLHDKHVFLEKPICLDIRQAEELINLAEKRNKIFMTGHVVRFMPPYQKLKQIIDSEEFGQIKFLALTRFSGRPGWGQWMEKEVVDASGGALFDLVIHDIDYANFLFGEPDDIECRCLAGTLSKHDYVSAMWNYKHKNIQVRIEGGNRFHKNLPFQAGYMAYFEKASILYTSFKGDVIQIADDQNIKEIPAGDPVSGYYNEIAYFADCIENNRKPVQCMPFSSLQSIKLCYKHIKN
jgi:predicted dehydrogenase